jgi:leader peptidase (prepilin peptidase) / N-methyltransferase
MFTLTIFIVFFLGACIGSFLSVVTERIRSGKKGILMGRSVCPKCNKKIHPLDLIPLVNYLILKGKCRKCKKHIPVHYPALELFSGLTFTTLFLRYPFTTDSVYALPFAIFAIYAVFLTAIFFYDLLNSEIPDLLLFPMIGLAVTGSLILGKPDIASMIIALIISFIFFGGQYLLSRGEWLGEGDVYLAIAMSFIFGWQLLIIAIIFTYLIGGITAVILLAAKKVASKSSVPFAPFLVLGTLITIFFGEEILNFYLTSVTL